MKYIQKFINAFNNFAVGMESRDWAIAAVIMIVVGVICMQGAASKSNL